MSMVSEICAENHLEIVRKAVEDGLAKAKTEEAKTLLKEVLKTCEEQIAE